MEKSNAQIEAENIKGCGDKYGFGCLLDILFVLMIFAIPVFSIIALFKSDSKWKFAGVLGLGFSILIFYTVYGNRNKYSGDIGFPSNPKSGDTFTKDGINYTWMCIQLNPPPYDGTKPATCDWYKDEYIKSLNLTGG